MDPIVLAALIAAVGSIITTIILAITGRKKINETHFQTTQNGNRNNPPTIPDRLHTIDTKVDALIDRFDKHIEWHLENK